MNIFFFRKFKIPSFYWSNFIYDHHQTSQMVNNRDKYNWITIKYPDLTHDTEILDHLTTSKFNSNQLVDFIMILMTKGVVSLARLQGIVLTRFWYKIYLFCFYNYNLHHTSRNRNHSEILTSFQNNWDASSNRFLFIVWLPHPNTHKQNKLCCTPTVYPISQLYSKLYIMQFSNEICYIPYHIHCKC